jgi:uncharacterized membrane protein YphA (DoxX/SURF4 family)
MKSSSVEIPEIPPEFPIEGWWTPDVNNARRIMNRLQNAGRYLLGSVLICSVAAKLADIPGFIRSVMVLGDMGRPLAGVAAAVVLMLEIGVSALLWSGRHRRWAFFSAAGLLGLFAVVLTAAVFREIAGTCGCFGSLGPHLPFRYQALGDLVLAAGALILAGELPRQGGKLLYAFLGFWGATLILVPGQAGGMGTSEVTAGTMGGTAAVPRVLLFADFSDFGCQVCLEDFLALCDSLNERMAAGGVQVRLIARRDTSREEEAQRRFLTGWAKGNSYGFPVSVDREGIFGSRGVVRTSVVVEAGDGGVIAQGSVPLGAERRSDILSLLDRYGMAPEYLGASGGDPGTSGVEEPPVKSARGPGRERPQR